MSIQQDLRDSVTKIFSSQWTTRDGQKVPEPEDLALGNDAVNLDASILYADMSGSTNMVDRLKPTVAAEVYKAYLQCAAKLIKNQGGTITAYDGDRVMAVYIGNNKNTSAAKTALNINWAVQHVINPAFKKQYGENAYQMNHCVGIDTSKILVSRIGVRNDNDLVWVGRAANYAAKLTELPAGYAYITRDVFTVLNESAKVGGDPTRSMWTECTWTSMSNMTIYKSNWYSSPT